MKFKRYVRPALWVFVALNFIIGIVLVYVNTLIVDGPKLDNIIGMHFTLGGLTAVALGFSYMVEDLYS